MKLAIGVLVFIWLLCGVIGARMEGDLDVHHWRDVAWGPFTLVEAWNEQGSLVPGP